MTASLSIVDGVRGLARSQAGALAVIDGDRQLTYAELDERSSRLGNWLIDSGAKSGDRVAVLLGNRLEYCEVAAGIAKAGLVMVPLNPRMAAPEVDYIVGHAGATTLIVDAAYLDLAVGVADTIERQLVVDADYESAVLASDANDPWVPIDEREPFCIAYTSGTTGKPKGVVISHRSRALTFYMSALEWNLGVGRRSIAVAPMYHGAGFAFGYAPVHTGGTVSMLRAWDPSRFLQQVQDEQIQSAFLVPTHAQMIRALGNDVIAGYDLSTLDTLFFNAAALPTTLKAWVLETFPNVGVHELYGSTESGIITNLRPADAARKSGSVGHGWHMTEIRVVNDDGEPVAPGEPGELFSRSPYLMNHYLNDPAATAACTTEDGFVTCGDVAVVDEEGYISIVDRKKDLIISGGSNVYPREVEEALLTVDAIVDAAVVGTPDETWGESVAAFVVTRPGSQVDLDGVIAHLRSSLAGYKLPRQLHVVDVLPRNAGGKVDKGRLRSTLLTPSA